jgi:hypothetical protein
MLCRVAFTFAQNPLDTPILALYNKNCYRQFIGERKLNKAKERKQ